MLALGAILLLALLLRLWGIKYGLPFGYQIDEERIYVRGAARMLDAGSVNPRSEERRVGKECRSRWSPYH